MDLSLRATFDREAELYYRARPAPPPALLRAILEQGHLTAGNRVLEVGCGTGQATRPLAEHGLKVHALELGPALAERARKALADYPDVTVETIAFEDYRSETPFDALVSVQAFHWLEPVAGLTQAASLLKSGGALLLAWHQDRPQDTAFERAVDPVYRRYEAPRELKRPTPNETPGRFTQQLTTSAEFAGLRVSRFPWQETYPKTRYLELLQTFSNVQAMAPDVRADFLREIAQAVETHGGHVVRHYESLLLCAYKRCLDVPTC